MTGSLRADGVQPGRLRPEDYARNFADVHPPLSKHEAFVESERCYFCHDAPCQTACPTSIDIPLFIRQISAGNDLGAAETILSANILGGMCARVCPTETLCEEACVREAAEGKPVKIGLLQRHATDRLMEKGEQIFKRAAPTGKRIAVIGGGPAGLVAACLLGKAGLRTALVAMEVPWSSEKLKITACFGVVQIAHGDSDEVLLKRLDDALAQAQAQGPNKVVALG